MANVKLSKISKSYGSLEVVHAIDLEVKSKEFVVLVGPSGCGKSTTLRMIAGLEEISAGELSIGDRKVNDIAPKDRDVAMVFQNYALYPHLNVADNIAFGLRIRKESKESIKKSIDEVSQILGLTDLLHRKPSELSGGQRQRVAMGRAIVRHPEVFLFDEPLSNLDAKLRTQMRAEIKHLHKRLGVTSIYVTHDQVEAMTLADRIVVMQDGNIEQVGTPMELFLKPANRFVASFIGSPSMNQIEGVVRKSGRSAAIELANDTSIPIILPNKFDEGQKVLIGVRPEHVQILPQEGKHWVKVNCTSLLVEPLGSEALVHTNVGDTPFLIKVETKGDIEILQDITSCYLNLENIHLFDSASGRVINIDLSDY